MDMKNKALIFLIIIIALLAVGFAIVKRHAIAPAPVEQEQAAVVQEPHFSWRFETDESGDGLAPKTHVALFDGKNAYDAGVYPGTCSEIAKENLLAGEMSGVLCWFAGGGDEIGVFANEDGGYELMHGTQDEGTAESAGFRGDFKVIAEIQ